MSKHWSPLALAFALAACGDYPIGPSAALEGPWPEPSVPTLTDQNPDTDVFQAILVAGMGTKEYLPGKPATVFAYRDGSWDDFKGTVPGPTIEAKQGDRILVLFKNELPFPLTIHWHGLRLPNASDGTPSSQVPVPPGGSYVYDFVAHDAGTFWYHPHLDGAVTIEGGLYGALRVKGPTSLPVAADRVFVLDDVKLDGDGQLSTQTDQLDVMLGRQGNVLLVNGHSKARLRVRAGTRERWRFVNSANGRFFNLRLGDRPFFVIGWDGGLLPRPYETTRVLIAPGERYEVLVSFGSEDVFHPPVLETVHYDRGHNIPDPGPRPLMTLEVVEGDATTDPATPRPEFPLVWGEWSPIPVVPTTPIRSFTLKEEEGVGGAFATFSINDQRFPEHVPIRAQQDAVEIWEIHNRTEMDHPFHLHGMFFQVLDINGVPPIHRGLKDTVNVPRDATLRFAVQHGTPGAWMYHCHILEHAERGMMGELIIDPPAGGGQIPVAPKH